MGRVWRQHGRCWGRWRRAWGCRLRGRRWRSRRGRRWRWWRWRRGWRWWRRRGRRWWRQRADKLHQRFQVFAEDFVLSLDRLELHGTLAWGFTWRREGRWRRRRWWWCRWRRRWWRVDNDTGATSDGALGGDDSRHGGGGGRVAEHHRVIRAHVAEENIGEARDASGGCGALDTTAEMVREHEILRAISRSDEVLAVARTQRGEDALDRVDAGRRLTAKHLVRAVDLVVLEENLATARRVHH
mmetsp:Transcript_30160/g.66079  ORF Transcript_30160/g.66079 Transcript_30160/m.66079 type:complete len:242 (-) Transcript_30160:1798-2523(-)